jgi:hypothetical protein
MRTSGLGRIASIIHVYPTLAELARKAGDQAAVNGRKLRQLWQPC